MLIKERRRFVPQPTTTDDENEAESEAHDENKVQEEKKEEGRRRRRALFETFAKRQESRPSQGRQGSVWPCLQAEKSERERDTKGKRQRERVAGLATDRALSLALRIHY